MTITRDGPLARNLVAVALATVQFCGVAVAASAQSSRSARAPAHYAGGRMTSSTLQGSLAGRVVEEGTGVAIGGADVALVELGRATRTQADGSFTMTALPEGLATLSVRRVGYAPSQRSVEIEQGQITSVEIALLPSALEIPGLVITGTGRERAAAETYQPTTILEDAELRRRLSTSVAATLAGEPGISERYNGPAASQPVIRGLSGDRVLILEDGNRSGDIAATGADHAVAIEPLTAERIEVVRGPAGLLYGSNALGGVINVVRDEVPRSLPERVSGMVSLQAESVNEGVAGGGTVLGSLAQYALRAELSGRTAGETRTPLGELPSTDFSGYNAGAGASRVFQRGYLGAAVRDYALDYGIPGVFQGELIPGAHEEGVSIDLRRSTARVDGALFPQEGPFHAVHASGNFVRYEQQEIEHEHGHEHVGTEFGQLLSTGRVVADHHHEPGDWRLEGAIGAWTSWKDFRAAGSSTGTRPARQFTLAGFGYEEVGRGAMRVQVGARYDWTRITPLDTNPSAVLRDIRTRDFGAVSGSLGGLYDLGEGFTLGASVSRSFRTPAIEELFSDGPHLASYSFEIGNPSLEPEFGLGTDLFVRIARSNVNAEITAFRNDLDNFIFYAPTDDLDPRFRRFPVFRAEQSDAVLWGAEAEAQWEVKRRLVLGGQGSFVRGTREAGGEPLPAMPPASAGLHARYERSVYFAGVELDLAAAQRRTGEFEEETDGYTLLGAHAGLRWTWGGRLHTLTLSASNLTDEVWRDHLSRIRAVAPQPGRNLRLLYRVDL